MEEREVEEKKKEEYLFIIQAQRYANHVGMRGW